MTSGGPGDHPLTDITHWHRRVFDEETDASIRSIAGLCSARELDQWWAKEIGWSATREVAAAKAAAFHAWLLLRARQHGWEVPVDEGAPQG